MESIAPPPSSSSPPPSPLFLLRRRLRSVASLSWVLGSNGGDLGWGGRNLKFEGGDERTVEIRSWVSLLIPDKSGDLNWRGADAGIRKGGGVFSLFTGGGSGI